MQDLPKGVDKIGDRVRTVDVSNNMLDSLPASMTPLKKIERLVGANNNISTILCDMTEWSKLKVSSHNCLTRKYTECGRVSM
jgi:Leucine-rich repeat (LRR) protein